MGAQRGGDPKGQHVREEELEERPGERTSRKASKAGELLGGRGPGRGLDWGGLERLRPEAAFSALGRKGRRGYVSGFLPEVKFPKLVADRPSYSP